LASNNAVVLGDPTPNLPSLGDRVGWRRRLAARVATISTNSPVRLEREVEPTGRLLGPTLASSTSGMLDGPLGRRDGRGGVRRGLRTEPARSGTASGSSSGGARGG
jgi:hypothetical protein